MKRIWPTCLVFFSLFVFSCHKNIPSESETTIRDIQGEHGFVGTVNGTHAFIAILVGEHEGIAYVCHGDEKISEWFTGEMNEPTELSLSNSAGAHISAHFTEHAFQGEVTLRDGITYSFSAVPGTAEDAGIYRVMGDQAIRDEVEAGWIIRAKGEERGALKIRSVFQRTPTYSRTDLVVNTTSYPVFRFSVPSPPAPGVPIPYPIITETPTPTK